LSTNTFGRITVAVDYIAEGLGSNSTLRNIDLSSCALRDDGVSTLARNLDFRNTTLQKLTLKNNYITSTGVGVLFETMEHNSHIMDLDLDSNRIGNEGAGLLARSLGNNALPNLTRFSLSQRRIPDDGIITLISALEQNQSLLHLDLRHSHLDLRRDSPGFSERVFLALAESLPEIKMLQRLDFNWCTGFASAMPLLLAGLRNNTSLFRIHVAHCALSSVPTYT
jgi:Ran GTPase-activating protein (RanGAP) involved in mRNA processing and transport